METYKAGQGSLTRLVTWTILILALCMGCVEIYSWIHRPASHSVMDRSVVPLEWFRSLPVFGVPFSIKFAICLAVFVGLVWFLKWFMHRTTTVDTLIETEMELKKVSWPTREESYNATWVVLLVTVLLTMSLWAFDGALRLVLGLVF